MKNTHITRTAYAPRARAWVCPMCPCPYTVIQEHSLTYKRSGLPRPDSLAVVGRGQSYGRLGLAKLLSLGNYQGLIYPWVTDPLQECGSPSIKNVLVSSTSVATKNNSYEERALRRGRFPVRGGSCGVGDFEHFLHM